MAYRLKNKVRFTLKMEDDIRDYFEIMAREEGVDIAELLKRGLAVMKAFREQKKLGRNHIGFASDPAKLDTEIIGVLNA